MSLASVRLSGLSGMLSAVTSSTLHVQSSRWRAARQFSWQMGVRPSALNLERGTWNFWFEPPDRAVVRLQISARGVVDLLERDRGQPRNQLLVRLPAVDRREVAELVCDV